MCNQALIWFWSTLRYFVDASINTRDSCPDGFVNIAGVDEGRCFKFVQEWFGNFIWAFDKCNN